MPGEPVPLGAPEFAALLDALGPFEHAPRIAVAVSGGPDSLALALLASAWAWARGGRAEGLTVDHGLRPESADEARQVAGMLAGSGMRHAILPWYGPKPASGIQAAARDARYALLERWCEREGVLHLLVAHHLEDQAETVLLRLGRGSGLAGLAGMASVVERRAIRIVRPLLTVPKARLTATLQASGHSAWVTDPSNTHPAFARARIRAALPGLAASGITPSRVAGTARRVARARAAIEGETAHALAQCVAMCSEGYAWIDPSRLRGFATEIRLRALAAVSICIGGLAYTPRLDRLERLHDGLIGAPDPVARTLGGCLFKPSRGAVLVCREPGRPEPPVAVTAPAAVLWNRRFRLCVAGAGSAMLRPLAYDGCRQLAKLAPELPLERLPWPVRVGLPSLWDGSRLLAVPHLGYGRTQSGPGSVMIAQVAFAPPQPLSSAGFMLA